MRGERRRPTPHLGDRLHPRNRYKDNAPNFYALGQRYPSFLQYRRLFCSISLRNVDHDKKTAALAFDDPCAVRELTSTLLQHDFGLDWAIPIDRLCPPLPNRLNYIHWIEDLLQASGVNPFAVRMPTSPTDTQRHTIRGIDIGTGASCIYALLGATINGWSVLATEIDDSSFKAAVENVARNELTKKIHVKRVATTQLLLEPLQDAPGEFQDGPIHFSMCNPPFFGDLNEADTNPDAACMGNTSEMMCPGGEVAFIGHMINDSKQLRDRVRIYTSMIGRKSSLRQVLALLRENEIHNVSSIEFFQGRTKRWGVAWSFVVDVPLQDQTKVLGKRKEAQRRQEFVFQVPHWSSEVIHGCRSQTEVRARIEEHIHSMKNLKSDIALPDTQTAVFNVKCSPVEIVESEEPLFIAAIEIDDHHETAEFCVTVKYESGMRDECWRFSEGLKAATVRTGRQWRRKQSHVDRV